MTRKLRAPRVSAAYSALLVEALHAGGFLIVASDGSGDPEAFRQRLLRANVLAQLELMRVAPARSNHPDGAHVFALTASGENLARTSAGQLDDASGGPPG